MKKILFHPFSALTFTLISIALLISLQNTNQKAINSKKNIKILESEVEQISQSLNHKKDQLQQAENQFSQEEIIRNELLMQKEGEYIIQIPDITPPSAKKKIEEITNPWGEWKKLLF